MCALYAFMRQTDDIADEPGDPRSKRARAGRLAGRARPALDGRPARWPGWPALADTVARHGIPPRLPRRGDRRRRDGRRAPVAFATFDDLYGYCYRVASAVGLCCLHIWGFRSDGGRAEALAEACGLALQLTNIVRDVREDARNGRVYLPARRHGPVRRLGRRPHRRARPASRSAACSPSRRPAPTIITSASRPLAGAGRPGRPARSCWRSSGSTAPCSTRSPGADYDVLPRRVSVPGLAEGGDRGAGVRRPVRPARTAEAWRPRRPDEPHRPTSRRRRTSSSSAAGSPAWPRRRRLVDRGLRITLVREPPPARRPGQLVHRPGDRRAGR